jgi:hypothetical protein
LVYVTIELRRIDEKIETDLIRELYSACKIIPRGDFSDIYECETDDLDDITKILHSYEKFGLEINPIRTGEIHVFIVSVWLGYYRTLGSGQIQIMRNGRILTYANRKELAEDSPVHEKDTFNNWEKNRCSAT